MPSQLMRRYLPDPEQILQLRALGPLRHRLATPGLWRLNRRSAAGAVFVGLYCAFLPIPAQMLIAAALALVFEVNLPACIAVVWIANPLTALPLFYGAYWLGCLLLGLPRPDETAVHQLLVYGGEHIRGLFGAVTYTQVELPLRLTPLLLGTQVAGLVAGAAGALGLRLYWRRQVLRAWRARVVRREQKHARNR